MIKRMKKRMFFLLIGVMSCFVTCFFSACSASDKEEAEIEFIHEEESSLTTTTVEYGEVVQSAKISCTYTSTEHQDLAFAVDDKVIVKVDVKEGDIVAAGDVLASAYVGDLQEIIDELEYQISHKNLELTHIKELKELDITSANNMYSYTYMTGEDKLKLQENLEEIDEKYHDSIEDLEDYLTISQKRLDKYKEELTGGQIIAGISGEITYIKNSMVDTYTEKDLKVITISNLDSCYFIADDATYADFFKEGESYNVVYKQNKVENYVEVTPVKTDEWQEALFFKPVNDEIFENGFAGTIYLDLEKKNNVLCVPNKAIHEADDGMFVYVMDNELFSMRYVEVGLVGTEVSEIKSGLTPGEIVVLK